MKPDENLPLRRTLLIRLGGFPPSPDHRLAGLRLLGHAL